MNKKFNMSEIPTSMKEAFLSVCTDLSSINEALGLNTDRVDAKLTLEYICELKAQIASAQQQEPFCYITKTAHKNWLAENKEAAMHFLLGSAGECSPRFPLYAAPVIPPIALPAAADRSDDLSMLVVRLARALAKAAPGHDLPREAMDYLKRNNLHGSPLRDMPTD